MFSKNFIYFFFFHSLFELTLNPSLRKRGTLFLREGQPTSSNFDKEQG